MLANKSMSPSPSAVLSSPSDNIRSKSKKKDENLRKYSQKVLSRKEVATPSKKRADTIDPNSVMSLKPASASVILESSNVMQAVHIMAAKRTDAVLVVDTDGELVGILTDKDISYRVVAEGLDARSTIIAYVMTKNPIHLLATDHRNDALTLMVERKFRHLPILSKIQSEDGIETCTVVGILDITKCVFDRLDELSIKANKDDALIQAVGTINENYGPQILENISIQIQGCPNVASVLTKIAQNPDYMIPEVTLRLTVKEASSLMKDLHATAVIVAGNGQDVAGILTTKDIILRVLAAQLEPNNTSIVRVMTSHPDFVTPECSILECLQKLKAGHYLHLPVVNDQGPAGLVDVSTLTISMLDYLMGKDDKKDLKGVLDLFWQTPAAEYTESEISESNSLQIRQEQMPPKKTMLQTSVKLRDLGTGTIYRFTLTSSSFCDLLTLISEKTGYALRYKSMHLLSANNIPLTIKFKDDESDYVIISNDRDLKEALCLDSKLELYLEETRKTSSNNIYYVLIGLALVGITTCAILKNKN